MSMNREQLIRICLNSGVVRRDVAINLIEIIEENTKSEVFKPDWSNYQQGVIDGTEAERDACAKVCEDIYNDPKGNNGYDCYYTRPYIYAAEAIRARGQQ